MAEHLVANDLNHPLTKAMNEFMSSEWDKSNVQENVAAYIASRIAFNQQILEVAMEKGELKQDDARVLAIILEALLIGLGDMSWRSQYDETLKVYRKAIHVFLQGTLNRLESI